MKRESWHAESVCEIHLEGWLFLLACAPNHRVLRIGNTARRAGAFKRAEDSWPHNAQRKNSRTACRELPLTPKIAASAGASRWTAAVERCVALLDMVRDEMTDYYEERSKAWQQSFRADEHQDNLKEVQRLTAKLDDLSF